MGASKVSELFQVFPSYSFIFPLFYNIISSLKSGGIYHPLPGFTPVVSKYGKYMFQKQNIAYQILLSGFQADVLGVIKKKKLF